METKKSTVSVRPRRSAPPARESAPHGGLTLANRTTQLLREEIISGRLRPAAPLRFDALRQDYGVSVTPLREALAMLVAERLVVQEDQRGFRVAPMSTTELDDIVERRLDMEPEALERSIRNGDEEWEVRLLAAQHRLRRVSQRVLALENGLDEEWEARHRELHLELLSACGSAWLLRFVRQLYDQFDRYRRVAGVHPATMRAIVGNREDPIVEAALARKASVARRLLERHIRDSIREIRRAFVALEAELGSE